MSAQAVGSEVNLSSFVHSSTQTDESFEVELSPADGKTSTVVGLCGRYHSYFVGERKLNSFYGHRY